MSSPGRSHIGGENCKDQDGREEESTSHSTILMTPSCQPKLVQNLKIIKSQAALSVSCTDATTSSTTGTNFTSSPLRGIPPRPGKSRRPHFKVSKMRALEIPEITSEMFRLCLPFYTSHKETQLARKPRSCGSSKLCQLSPPSDKSTDQRRV